MMVINKFDKSESAGHDDIGNSIAKKVSIELAKPFTVVFDLSLPDGKVPNTGTT